MPAERRPAKPVVADPAPVEEPLRPGFVFVTHPDSADEPPAQVPAVLVDHHAALGWVLVETPTSTDAETKSPQEDQQ